MVITKHAAVPGESVLVQLPRRLKIAESAQVTAEVIGGPERVGVVITKHATPPDDNVLMQLPRRLKIAESAQVVAEVVN